MLVNPIYATCSFSKDTVALYMMQVERQFPSSGHLVGCLQLHVFLLGSMMFFSIYYFCIMCLDDLLHFSCAPTAIRICIYIYICINNYVWPNFRSLRKKPSRVSHAKAIAASSVPPLFLLAASPAPATVEHSIVVTMVRIENEKMKMCDF